MKLEGAIDLRLPDGESKRSRAGAPAMAGSPPSTLPQSGLRGETSQSTRESGSVDAARVRPNAMDTDIKRVMRVQRQVIGNPRLRVSVVPGHHQIPEVIVLQRACSPQAL